VPDRWAAQNTIDLIFAAGRMIGTIGAIENQLGGLNEYDG
jgi:hypothetical protein